MRAKAYIRRAVSTYSMGKVTLVLPDEVEMALRRKAVELFKGKKGALGLAAAEAIKVWVKRDS